MDFLRDLTVNERLHSLALTSMSVRDLPLLYERIGGFLKIGVQQRLILY